MITGHRVWDDMTRSYRNAGFSDMHKTVNYLTSHDVEAYNEQRLLNFHLTEILRWNGIQPGPGETDVQFIKRIVDSIASQPANIQAAHAQALERVGSSFALMLTSAGVPMFLAGEEFGDVHDLEHSDWRLKQSDPVDYERREYLGHKTLLNRVGQLITLRAQHPALQRNEVEFFCFHPTMDDNNGTRVFAYCRTGGQPLGSSGQVVVVANTGPDNFPIFNLPWRWTNARQLGEVGTPLGAMNPQVTGNTLSLSLAPFQVRVFTT
jgi:1,4-alpha-glucan branching enzyme